MMIILVNRITKCLTNNKIGAKAMVGLKKNCNLIMLRFL